MKIANTSDRLKEIMRERNLKQVDILNAAAPYCEKYNVKLNKSDISQYISGKTEPNQNKLYVLSEALNVNVSWLMGFDEPMERENNLIFDYIYDKSCIAVEHNNNNNNKMRDRLIKYFTLLSKLSDVNARKAINYAENLLSNQQLEEELNPIAAHERTDIEVTSEMKKHDDDIMKDDSLWK